MSYIAGLGAATAVVTEALKSLFLQHPPCEAYCSRRPIADTKDVVIVERCVHDLSSVLSFCSLSIFIVLSILTSFFSDTQTKPHWKDIVLHLTFTNVRKTPTLLAKPLELKAGSHLLQVSACHPPVICNMECLSFGSHFLLFIFCRFGLYVIVTQLHEIVPTKRFSLREASSRVTRRISYVLL